MRVMKWSMIALTVSAVGSQLAMAEPFVTSQADAPGFVEGAKAGVVLENFYFNRTRQDQKTTKRNKDSIDWTQGIRGKFSSGYTQGTVGVKVDGFGDAAYKLYGRDDEGGSLNLPRNSTNTGNDNSYGKAGADIAVRISKTELKFGDFTPNTAPVFAFGTPRQFQQTARGFQLQSSEIKDLDLDAGHFYASSSEDNTTLQGNLFSQYGVTPIRSIDYVGGKYGINENLSVSLYGAKAQDTWNQYYTNATYTLPLATDQALNFDFNLYRTTDTGAAKAGKISNTAYSLATSYSFLKAHTVTLAFQKIDGNEPFDYIGAGDKNRGTESIFLSNSIEYSDFNAPGERSLQARYDLKMAEYGIPGLSFMLRYAHGEGIDGTHMNAVYAAQNGYGSDGHHFETNLEAKYVVQSGPLKNLSIRARQAWHRANAAESEGNVNDFRLITDYPINFL